MLDIRPLILFCTQDVFNTHVTRTIPTPVLNQRTDVLEQWQIFIAFNFLITLLNLLCGSWDKTKFLNLGIKLLSGKSFFF